MSVTLISVSHDTIVSNKHEERIRHYYVNFQQYGKYDADMRRLGSLKHGFNDHSLTRWEEIQGSHEIVMKAGIQITHSLDGM